MVFFRSWTNYRSLAVAGTRCVESKQKQEQERLEVRNEHNVDARREMQFVHLNVPSHGLLFVAAVGTRCMPDIVVQKFTVDVYTHLKLSLCRCRHVWNTPDCWSLCDLVCVLFSLVVWENYLSEDDFFFFREPNSILNLLKSQYQA